MTLAIIALVTLVFNAMASTCFSGECASGSSAILEQTLEGTVEHAPTVSLLQTDLQTRMEASIVSNAGREGERSWFACEGAKSAQASTADVKSEIAVLFSGKCTKPAPIRKLCCSRWQPDDFKIPSLLNLRSEQQPTSNKTSLVQDGQQIVKICTVRVSPSKHAGAIEEPAECITKDFSMEQLKGEEGGLKRGELVLRERLLWFQQSGVSMDSVPKCHTMDVQCDDGEKPVTVDLKWLEGQDSNASLIQNGTSMMQAGSDGRSRLSGALREGTDGFSGNFAGALMTSGSFTMMAAGGGV